MIFASADTHALVIQVIAGLIVLLLVALVGIALKVLSGQRRTHEALWGYTEGNTQKKGLVEIVQGNGHGSILEVAEAGLAAATANGVALDVHVQVDEERWDLIEAYIVPHTSPPAKKAVRKRAAPKTPAP